MPTAAPEGAPRPEHPDRARGAPSTWHRPPQPHQATTCGHHPLHPLVRQDLVQAFRLEASAQAGYLLAAQQARIDGRVELARLFEGFGDLERFDHLARTVALVGMVGSDADHLRDAARRAREAAAAYHDAARRASAVGDPTVSEHFATLRAHAQARQKAFTDAVHALDPADPAE